jgi:flagellar biosynthesis protein FlhB
VRALFRVTDVGDFIPRQFYRAIAEVLALVMRIQAQGQVAKVA